MALKRQASAASERDLYSRTAHSHLSILTESGDVAEWVISVRDEGKFEFFWKLGLIGVGSSRFRLLSLRPKPFTIP